jgi:hypothetical protein
VSETPERVAVDGSDRPRIAYIAQLAVGLRSIRSGAIERSYLIPEDGFLLIGVRDCGRSGDISKSWQQQVVALGGKP